ncbi:MAG: hypothetical protein FWD79_02490 [Desulfobulbus sp.]|nr:hypothetical protein [Desulfobulbus sp.]
MPFAVGELRQYMAWAREQRPQCPCFFFPQHASAGQAPPQKGLAIAIQPLHILSACHQRVMPTAGKSFRARCVSGRLSDVRFQKKTFNSLHRIGQQPIVRRLYQFFFSFIDKLARCPEQSFTGKEKMPASSGCSR